MSTGKERNEAHPRKARMVPLRVLTLIVIGPGHPSVLVLEPVEDTREGAARVVPIWIGPNEAAQLGAAIEHAKLPRPMTHDLFLDALTNLDARIDHVLINDLHGSIFHTKLVIRQADRAIELDARPTDSLALAIRQDAPYYIDEDVLERASFPYLFKQQRNEEEELEQFRSFLEELAPGDFND